MDVVKVYPRHSTMEQVRIGETMIKREESRSGRGFTQSVQSLGQRSFSVDPKNGGGDRDFLTFPPYAWVRMKNERITTYSLGHNHSY